MMPSKPNRSSSRSRSSVFCRLRRIASAAFSQTARSLAGVIGFSRKLNAPCCIASTALGTVACPVTRTTSASGSRSRQRLPDAEVVLVTGHATVPKAVEAMQQGAFNFLEKPITPAKLRAVCEKAADAIRLKRQNTELRERLDERFGFEGIIYASSQMQTVIDRLKRIAPTDATVLIAGESGT